MEEATGHLRRRELAAALRLLRRASLCLKLITEQLDMLEQMSPWEYTSAVRPVLGHGSGFDSPGWSNMRRVAPELGQAFSELRQAEELSLVDIYRRGRELEELYQLAEALLELDERATMWRLKHLKVVERIIGGEVVGTQGTPVELLEGLTQRRFYPELWQVRNTLTELAKEEEGWRSRS